MSRRSLSLRYLHEQTSSAPVFIVHMMRCFSSSWKCLSFQEPWKMATNKIVSNWPRNTLIFPCGSGVAQTHDISSITRHVRASPAPAVSASLIKGFKLCDICRGWQVIGVCQPFCPLLAFALFARLRALQLIISQVLRQPGAIWHEIRSMSRHGYILFVCTDLLVPALQVFKCSSGVFIRRDFARASDQ